MIHIQKIYIWEWISVDLSQTENTSITIIPEALMFPSRSSEADATYGFDKLCSTSANSKPKIWCWSKNLFKNLENCWHVFPYHKASFNYSVAFWQRLLWQKDIGYYKRRAIMLRSWQLEFESRLCNSVCLETDQLNGWISGSVLL